MGLAAFLDVVKGNLRPVPISCNTYFAHPNNLPIRDGLLRLLIFLPVQAGAPESDQTENY